MDMQGIRDGKMYELTEQAKERRTMQAPNRAGTWSRSQQPREVAMSGPRFEQTIMEMQVGSLPFNAQGYEVEIELAASFGCH